jgi:hypothetical protein
MQLAMHSAFLLYLLCKCLLVLSCNVNMRPCPVDLNQVIRSRRLNSEVELLRPCFLEPCSIKHKFVRLSETHRVAARRGWSKFVAIGDVQNGVCVRRSFLTRYQKIELCSKTTRMNYIAKREKWTVFQTCQDGRLHSETCLKWI